MTPDQYCQQKAAGSGSSFYYSFLFLEPARRQAITALYAFCREVDDAVDECSDATIAARKLDWWRSEVGALHAGQPTHPVTLALAAALPRFNLPVEQLLEIIDGMEMDLHTFRYADFKSLHLYCYRVAAVVGLLAAEIFGYADRRTLKYAHDLGLAFQLTNIIRDVGEDARRGRIYLPQDELARFGVTEQDILQSRSTGAFQQLMRFQVERADRLLRQGARPTAACRSQGTARGTGHGGHLPASALRNRSGRLPRPLAPRGADSPDQALARRQDLAYRMTVQAAATRPIAVVGAGYAGLAAAVDLVTAGFRVEVFEASRTLGGRARAVEVDGLRLDNGAHILAGAYTETLRLLDVVGADTAALQRHPLHLELHGVMRLAAPAWPAGAASCRLGTRRRARTDDRREAGSHRIHERPQGPELPARMPTAASPNCWRTSPRDCGANLWEPLCLAALNTPPDQASAQVFLNVLRDSLGANREASDLLLPVSDLSSLFPEPAARFLDSRGSQIQRGTRITRLTRSHTGFHLDDHGPYPQVILAVAPYHLPTLISELPELAALGRQLAAFEWQPIVTCYLRYEQDIRLSWPMIGVADGLAQWLFDLEALRGMRGTVAAVISARGRHQQLDAEDLAAAIHAEIAGIVPGLSQPVWSRVITEQRATFACTPGLLRPATATALPGLWLAGDYVAGDYPATIEGAVRSGIAAARSVRDEPTARQA